MSRNDSKKDYLISEQGDISILERIHLGLGKAGIPKRGRNLIVATKTGYSPSMVAKLLSGHAKLSFRFINAICSSFDIRGEWVGEGIEPALVPDDEEERIALEVVEKKRLYESLDDIFGSKPPTDNSSPTEKQLTTEEAEERIGAMLDPSRKARAQKKAFDRTYAQQLITLLDDKQVQLAIDFINGLLGEIRK